MSPLLRRLALTSLIANVAIVVTGGAVRLTGSGMGCPTWPRCTDASYTATREMGVHGAIEFGNRLLSIAVGLIAVALVLVAWRARRRGPSALLGYAAAVLALVVAQGVVGGISVRVHLDPWVVGAHFLLSMVLLALGYALWRRSAEASAPVADPSVPPSAVPGPLRSLTWVLAAASFLVLVAGTVVTGGGPHSGDPEAGRNGLDPETVS
ncbi:MAG TPA: COX15/CtaA family protein, partial [Micromonosporaceae bacterium]|nr:COX15/CtaA family protein [Micromonosporaceae bacterium]